MKPIQSSANTQSGDNTGNAIIGFMATSIVLAGIGLTVYDYYNHGRQWFWHRIKDENRLREQEGMEKKSIIQHITGLFEDKSTSW